LHPRVSIEEIFILANDPRTNQKASPSLNSVMKVLNEARNGLLKAPLKYESRFHILNHTDFLQATNGWIHLRETISPEDTQDLLHKLNTINNLTIQFNGFDKATNEQELKETMYENSWGKYFDGIVSLSADTVRILTNDSVSLSDRLVKDTDAQDDLFIGDYSKLKFKYPLKVREEYQPPATRSNHQRDASDPEVTKIKRQRSNLSHKIITQKVDEYLRELGAVPYENEHIDLFAQIPSDGSFLFEIKSVSSDNLLSQTRKGLSQLYEYRYRYLKEIGENVTLCLVYPKEPNEIEWLQEYLCSDRGISVCWFENESLCFPTYCAEKMEHLLPKRK
jgi:hypothetical protein